MRSLCCNAALIQNEDQALEYIKDFYKDVFGALEEAEEAQDTERWFLRRYYQKLRKHYHRLLGKQEKTEPGSGVKTLAEIPAAFPLLHRIMLVMSFKDDFPASEISAIYGLAEDKIQSELEKLEKLLPSIVQDQPESAAAYTASWKVLLLGASRQISNTGSDQWVDSLYADAAKAAGVPADTAQAGAAAKSDEWVNGHKLLPSPAISKGYPFKISSSAVKQLWPMLIGKIVSYVYAGRTIVIGNPSPAKACIKTCSAFNFPTIYSQSQVSIL